MALNIALSLVGFSGFLALDWHWLRHRPVLSAACSAAASFSLVVALLLIPDGPALLPAAWRLYAGCIGAALVGIGATLLAYSILVEIPLLLRRARVNGKPVNSDPSTRTKPVVTGTYALCRHPGYLWLSLLLAGYILAADNVNAIVVSLLWMAFNFLVVLAQDRWIFPAIFQDYDLYQASTPFLIPHRASISRAFAGQEEHHANL